MDVMELANSLPMWIACGIPVIFVMIQALLFARTAYPEMWRCFPSEESVPNALTFEYMGSILSRVHRLSRRGGGFLPANISRADIRKKDNREVRKYLRYRDIFPDSPSMQVCKTFFPMHRES